MLFSSLGILLWFFPLSSITYFQNDYSKIKLEQHLFLSEIVVYENCPLWNYTLFGNRDELLLETVKGKKERKEERKGGREGRTILYHDSIYLWVNAYEAQIDFLKSFSFFCSVPSLQKTMFDKSFFSDQKNLSSEVTFFFPIPSHLKVNDCSAARVNIIQGNYEAESEGRGWKRPLMEMGQRKGLRDSQKEES